MHINAPVKKKIYFKNSVIIFQKSVKIFKITFSENIIDSERICQNVFYWR